MPLSAVLFFGLLFSTENKNIEKIPAAGPQKVVSDTFSFNERLTLFLGALNDGVRVGISKDQKQDKFKILFVRPLYQPDVEGMLDGLTKQVKSYNSTLVDFVLGDTISIFGGVEFCYQNKTELNPKKCEAFFSSDIDTDQKLKQGFSTDEKVSFFIKCLTNPCEFYCDSLSGAIVFILQSEAFKRYMPLYQEWTANYARLVYAYVLAADNRYHTLKFFIRNVDENKAIETSQYTYHRSDKIFTELHAYLKEFGEVQFERRK